jgi:predicted ATPase
MILKESAESDMLKAYEECFLLMKQFDKALTSFEERFYLEGAKDYSFAGSLGHVREQLKELLQFLGY